MMPDFTPDIPPSADEAENPRLGKTSQYFGGAIDPYRGRVPINPERARQNQILTEQSILLMAINAFFNVQSHQQEIAINENNVRVLTEQARAVQDRFALGAVTRTDVSQAKARLAAATGRLERSKGTLKSSIAQYQSVIGTAPIDLMMPDFTPDIPPSADEAETLALAKHPVFWRRD